MGVELIEKSSFGNWAKDGNFQSTQQDEGRLDNSYLTYGAGETINSFFVWVELTIISSQLNSANENLKEK